MKAESGNEARKRAIWTDASDAAAQSQASTLSTSTIDHALIVTGNLTSRGNLVVHGHVKGAIRCHSLVLGEKSHVEGDVVADDVAIHGRLTGTVHALSVVLRRGCHVEGDLYHQTLMIEQGVYFQGQSFRVAHPSSQEKT